MHRTLFPALPLALALALGNANANPNMPAPPPATPLETFAATSLYWAVREGSAAAGDGTADKKVNGCIGARDASVVVDLVRDHQEKQFTAAERASMNAFLATGGGTRYANNRFLVMRANESGQSVVLGALSPEELRSVHAYLATPIGKRLDSDEVLGDEQTVGAVTIRVMRLITTCLNS